MNMKFLEGDRQMKNLTKKESLLMTIDELLDDRSVAEKAFQQIAETIHYFNVTFSERFDTVWTFDRPGAPRTINQDALQKAQEFLVFICSANSHYEANNYTAMHGDLIAAEQAIWEMKELAQHPGTEHVSEP
jgi:hypothetical protein